MATKVAPKVTPKVGMGGYRPAGSDRYPIHVVSVGPDNKWIEFVSVDCKRLDNNGMSEMQTWGEWTPRMSETPVKARLGKGGYYYTEGGSKRGNVVVLGEYNRYNDPHF